MRIVKASKRETRAKSVVLALLLVFGFVHLGCRKRAATATAPPSDRPVSEAIGEADQLYRQRADLMKVRQGLLILRRAQAGDPGNYDVAWRIAKFDYYLGGHSSDEGEKEQAFHEGIEAGKLAARISPDKPDGHFWLGANYGGNAEINTLAGLADIEDIKHEMEVVLKLDERYEGGSGYLGLGQVYMKAPRLLGGDLQKAIEYLQKGIKLEPNNGLLRLRMAEAYVAAHQNAEARKQIDALRSMKPMPGYDPEYNDAIEGARKLEEKMK